MASVPTDIEKKAGIETFREIGYINIVNSLAGGDVLRWEAIMNLPFEQVFLKQLLNKKQFAYQEKYQELMMKK